ncbi:MAG: BON domain-containing protein [Burkholderiales bacterium]|nr:BON domain-containing protein [Burkholderiales bacterium]
MSARTALLLAALAAATPALQGCLPVMAGAAVGGGVLIAEDRRSSGTYVDDEGIELRAASRITERVPQAHVNVTSFNKVVLLTGEVPDAASRTEAAAIARAVPGVKTVQNELVVGPNSKLSDRTTDSYTTTKVKARFVDARRFQPNHVKVVTEAATVYLMGLVKAAEAKDAAEVAAATSGVAKVVQVFEIIE